MGPTSPDSGHSSGGLRRFLILVAVLFAVIAAAVGAIALLDPDGGLSAFNYDGFG